MIYLIAVSMVWAFSYGLIKVNLTSLDPNFVTFCRMAFALPLFLPFLKIKKVSLSETFQLLIIGAIQYGAMYLFFIRSFQYLDAHQAALFTTMTPFYIILINAIWEKRFTPTYFITSLLAVLGGVIIYYKYSGDSNILTGCLLVQGSDICFAFGQVAYKRFRKIRNDLKDSEIYALLFLGALITAACSTTWFNGWGSLARVTMQQFTVLVYLGSIASGLGFFMWNKGAVKTNTGTLAVLNNVKSPLAILVSLLFFNEHPNLLRLSLGFAVIFFALYLSEKYEKESRKIVFNFKDAEA